MKLKDVQSNKGNIDLVVQIVKKEEPRSFEKFGKSGRVCNTTVRDESGQMKLTLWNDDIDRIKQGDTIRIQNGWCSEFKGEKQLSTGKFGKIELIPAGAGNQLFTNDPGMLAAAGKGGVGNGDDEGDGDGDDSDQEEESEPVEEEEFVD